MPNPNTNFKLSDGRDLGNVAITKEYLMTVYPQVANQLITPELWTWGSNSSGELGINSIDGQITPVTTFAGGTNWKQIGCAQYHTAAIKTDGTLWTWGSNSIGQLGINNTTDRSTPVTTFAGGSNWKQFSCGQNHTAAIKTDGTLWIWGRNAYGQLGINVITNNRSTPVTTFAGGTNWKQVSCGAEHTSAIKTDGTLWLWGWNYYGQLGTNNRSDVSSGILTPVTTFAGGSNWKQVSATAGVNTVAIKTDGTLWTWGYNYSASVGNNTINNHISIPVTTFAGGTNWKQVACGNQSVAAIKTDGTLWTWGSGNGGILGINDEFANNRLTPVTTFAGGTNWKQVSVGTYFMSAIKTDGTLWVWGTDVSSGGLGTNELGIGKLTPVTTFAGGTNWKQVACGEKHMTAIKTSDDLQGI